MTLKNGAIIVSVVLGTLISALGLGCKSHNDDIECVYGSPPNYEQPEEPEDTTVVDEPEPADKQ